MCGLGIRNGFTQRCFIHNLHRRELGLPCRPRNVFQFYIIELEILVSFYIRIYGDRNGMGQNRIQRRHNIRKRSNRFYHTCFIGFQKGVLCHRVGNIQRSLVEIIPHKPHYIVRSIHGNLDHGNRLVFVSLCASHLISRQCLKRILPLVVDKQSGFLNIVWMSVCSICKRSGKSCE